MPFFNPEEGGTGTKAIFVVRLAKDLSLAVGQAGQVFLGSRFDGLCAPRTVGGLGTRTCAACPMAASTMWP